MDAKPVSRSCVTVVQQMTQMDANINGNVHGGVILKLVDNTAGIVAGRHAGGPVVTACIDGVEFHSPVFVGDLLRVHASVNYTGTTSMEIGVRVEAEDVMTGEVRHTGSAYLVFVALDEQHQPRAVAPLQLVTDDDRRRNCEARVRRKVRLEKAQRTQAAGSASGVGCQ